MGYSSLPDIVYESNRRRMNIAFPPPQKNSKQLCILERGSLQYISIIKNKWAHIKHLIRTCWFGIHNNSIKAELKIALCYTKESNFCRPDNAIHNCRDCLKILNTFTWVFPQVLLAISAAYNTYASLKLKMTFIYEKQVQVPALWAWMEDSLSISPIPKGFWYIVMFGSRRLLFSTPIVIICLHPVYAVPIELEYP